MQLGRFRGQIELEDAPYFVETYDPANGQITLSDQTEEPLRPETVEARASDVLYCRVKGRFDARFTRTAQASLLQSVDLVGDRPVLCIGSVTVPLPRLDPGA